MTFIATHEVVENPLVPFGSGNLTCEFCDRHDEQLHNEPCDFVDEPDYDSDESHVDAEYDRDSENLRLLALYNRRRARSRQRIEAAFAKLDAIAARFAPTGPSTLDVAVAHAAALAPRVTLDLAPARVAPAEDVRPVRCTCEANSYAVQVVRATEYNERRALDAPAWTLPDFVLDRAAEAMADCPATVHFPSLLADTWYGLDTMTSVDDEVVERNSRAYEDALAAQSSQNVLGERWEGEYDSYEQTDRFVRDLTEKRRTELAALIRYLGQDPADPKIVTWVKMRIASKHGNALRGYMSCLASLWRRVAV